MNDLVDLVSNMRDLVNEYDDLITRLKYVKAASRTDPGKLDNIILQINKLLDKTATYLDMLSNIDLEGDGEYIRYLKTYHSYLLMISIPYVADLLEEIHDTLDNGESSDKAKALDMFIEKFREILDNY